MVSWKGLAAVLVVLAAVGAYTWFSRPQPAPVAAHLFPCQETNMVGLLVQAPAGAVVEISRPAIRENWVVVKPVQAAANQDVARQLAEDLYSIQPQGTVASPGPVADYGLDAPRDIVTCRVKDGTSYTLTVGKETFDGGAYYALKGGDPRIYVVSSVPIDDFDRNLKDPPVSTPAP
jgi:hypothetical protein